MNCQIKPKCFCLKKGTATLSILPPGCSFRSFLSRCWPHPPPPNTTSTIYPVDTRHSNLQFSCFKCQPAVDYAVSFAIKTASQKNLMHLECKGYKVLFLKGIHYHNKERTIYIIKHACCHHIALHTTQQVIWAVWAQLENSLTSIDEWERKTLYFCWNFVKWQLMMDGMSWKKRHEKLRGGW